jgi:hypothetical protein
MAPAPGLRTDSWFSLGLSGVPEVVCSFAATHLRELRNYGTKRVPVKQKTHIEKINVFPEG